MMERWMNGKMEGCQAKSPAEKAGQTVGSGWEILYRSRNPGSGDLKNYKSAE